MRKRSIFLFFALIAQFCIESSWAHVNFLPRTPAQLVQVGSEEIMLHVRGAQVAWMNRAALDRDFPELKVLADADLEKWILQNCSLVSFDQIRLNGIRNSSIPLDLSREKIGYRAIGGGRASTVQVSMGQLALGLIDLKGIGVNTQISDDSIENQIERYHEAGGAEDALSELRVLSHSDGLMSLGEAIAEVVRSEALQKSFELESSTCCGPSFETVESYFIISFPFDVLKEGNKADRAALVGRQAHLGRSGASQQIPNSYYVDFFGGKQGDLFGAAIDMGGVFPTHPVFEDRFLSEEQRMSLEKPILSRADLARLFNPQKSKEWVYSHETAVSFVNGYPRAVYDHMGQMLGSRTARSKRHQVVQGDPVRMGDFQRGMERAYVMNDLPYLAEVIEASGSDFRFLGLPRVLRLVDRPQVDALRVSWCAEIDLRANKALVKILGALGSSVSAVRNRALEAIERLNPECPEVRKQFQQQLLRMVLSNQDVLAVRTLVKMNSEDADLISDLLRSPHGCIRMQAIDALHELKVLAPQVQKQVLTGLSDPAFGVKLATLNLIEKIDWVDGAVRQEAYRLLVEKLEDDDEVLSKLSRELLERKRFLQTPSQSSISPTAG